MRPIFGRVAPVIIVSSIVYRATRKRMSLPDLLSFRIFLFLFSARYNCRMRHFGLRHTKLAIGGAALALCAAIGFAPALAFAETYTVSPLGATSQYGIEALSTTYETARQRAAEATEAASESEKKVAELETEAAEQQERTDAAVRDLYVMEQGKLSLIDAMLSAESFDDLVKYADYIERASRTNATELNALKDLIAELEKTRDALVQEQQEAAAQEEVAREALAALQDQRAAKQRSEKADDGADWYMSQEEFIAEWAPRINAYFESTPMAGTGESFARASWLYCIDPRWSPAISNIESSKGAHCIRPHNAWGWGAADSDPYNLASEWKTWDEAIDAHVKGLARGYGYTISLDKAKTYCPPNYEHWYEVTAAEMAKI